MKLGKFSFFFLISVFFNQELFAEDKIIEVPLVNLDELKPSYEEEDVNTDIRETSILNLKIKNKPNDLNEKFTVKLMGLDKITAKTSEIKIKLGDTKKFGLLEIKALRCGKVVSKNNPGEVAYIQVKDVSYNQREKVFIFNGWTFSSNPSLTPFDHAIYDIWLVSCGNV
jgi:hypothetical protein|tara:strand:- start:3454 stop:3960 length:507 start_codon:yes stop_codon:yes gene_type:complete